MRRTPSSASVRIVLAMVVMCATLLAFPALAHAAPNSISGTVTDATNGAGIPVITVYLYSYDGSVWNWLNSTGTDADGGYEFAGLAPGDQYGVGFFDWQYGAYLDQYWNAKGTQGEADFVVVTEGAVTSGIDAALVRDTAGSDTGTITGRVTCVETGWALPGMMVYLYAYEAGSGTWWEAYATQTGSDGAYLFAGLPAGAYRLSFDAPSPYLDEFYRDESNVMDAQSVSVPDDGDVRDIDEQLNLIPSAIAGTVVHQASGDPLADVAVRRYDGDGADFNDSGVDAWTDANGHFAFGGLPANEYKLFVYDPWWPRTYLDEYFEDAGSLTDAAVIALDGSNVSIDTVAELALAGRLGGQVTAEDTGDPLNSVYVELYRYAADSDSWSWLNSAYTDGSGRYEFNGLAHGEYKLHFRDEGTRAYVPEYYNDVHAGQLDATIVTVGETPVLDADAALALGASVSGTVVREAGGAPIQSAQVTAYYYVDGVWTTGSGYYAYTDSAGEFTLGGLPLGTYRFQASYGFHQPEYWQESSTVAGGTSITLTDTTTVPGVDFTLAEYPTISGRATDLGGTGLYSVYVSAYQKHYNSDGSEYWSSTGQGANTDSNGYYTINYLTPGTYRIRFFDNYGDGTNYLTEYYPDQPTVWAGADVSVGPGDDVTSVDTHMSTGNTISGTVYNSGSTPLSGVLVRAFTYNDADNDWERIGNDAYTNGSGAYTVTGLTDGTYRLGYYLNGYAIEYYDNDANAFDAQSIVAPDGTPITGIDMHLDAQGAQTPATVSGTVTADTGGVGIQNVQVIAYRSDPMLNGGWYWANSTSTNASGAYSMSVPPGLYRFRFNDYGYTYIGEYYDDATDAKSASMVTAAPGTTVPVSAGLATGGAISGTVRDAETHAPLGSVSAYVYYEAPDENWYFVSSDSTDENGTYRAGAIGTGEFRMQFTDNTGTYRGEYYDDTQYTSEAAVIPVTLGDETTGIDADLDRYGGIQGVVSGDDRQGIDGIRVRLFRRTPDSWSEYTSAVTLGDGWFNFAQLEPGQYIVRCEDEGGYGFVRYLSEYYLDETRSDQATVLDVTNSTHEITITLDSTGTWGDIAGTVTDAATGDAIEGMPVCLYEDDGAGGWAFYGRYTATAQDGTYWLQWVPAGEYRILADPTWDMGSGTPWVDVYAPTYHLDAAAVGDADSVTVAAGAETPGIDVHVATQPGVGYLGGTVIEDGTGLPVSNATVTMWSAAGGDRQVYAYDSTDDFGRFKRPVLEGPYVLEFADGPRHRAEFYEDVMTGDPWDADVLTVAAPASTEVTASLEPLGSMAGTVRDEVTLDPIAGIEADVYVPNAGGGLDYAGGVITDSNGHYEVSGLRYGPCRVWFYDVVGQRYVSEAFNNKPDPDHGDDVTVGAAPAIVDVELTPASSISGTVTDALTHAPIPNVYAMYYVYDADNFVWNGKSGDYTDSNGTYTLPILPAGTYRIRFSDSSQDYADEYWNDAWEVELADDIVLAVGEDRTGIDAQLVEGGTITGTVTNVVTTAPLASANVYAYQWSEHEQDWAYARSTSTNASGQYTLRGLQARATRLYFSRSGYLVEYHDNKRDVWAGDDVLVTEGGTHVIDAALLQSPGTYISGHVTNAGGSPLPSVLVSALRYDARHGVYVLERSDYTDGSGNYQIEQLNDGLYRIDFWYAGGGMQREYYNDQPTVELAEDVAISNGQPTTGIDAALSPSVAPPTGTVAGTVLSDATGLPVEGIAVRIGYYAPAASQWQFTEYTQTAADGTYSFQAPVGTTRLYFYDVTGTYISEYFHNATDVWDGSDVIVTEGATTAADEGLATAGHIGGTVTAAAGGFPLQDIYVSVYRYAAGDWDYVDQATTAVDGTYDIGGLEPGTYRAELYDAAGVYRGEYFDNARSMSDATNITLGPGESRTDVDVQLDTYGVIGGTVTDEATGRPVENLRVYLWRDYGSSTSQWTYATTDHVGQYRFSGLEPGTWLVQFADDDPPVPFRRFVSEYYDDQPDEANATRLVVTTQTVVADAQLTSTGTWGSIEGTVTDGASGHALANMPVDLYYYDGGAWAQTWTMAYTDASGAYLFPYVPEQAGQAPYRVGTPIAGSPALSTYYQETFHLNATAANLALDVPLVANAHLSGVDIEMVRQPGIGWLSGTVRAEGTDEPLGGITVELQRTSGAYVGSTTTLADGTYGFPVTADSYALKFYDSTQSYAAEWYDDKTQWWAADPVTVTAGGSATADVWLAEAATITGSVHTSSGDPLETWVYVHDAATWNTAGQVWASGGAYSITGLRPGDYYVQFDSTGPYMREYWNDRMSEPDTIVLAAGETSSSIDATLTIGGRISGIFTSDDGLLAADGYLEVYREEALGWTWVRSQTAYSWNGWSFETDPLLPGTYRVLYWDGWGQYSSLYYDAVSTPDQGTGIIVNEDATTPVTLRLDGLPPEVGSDVVSDYDTSASIEVTATDAVVGVDSVFYALDGGDVVTAPGSAVTTDVVGWGDHSIEYWAQDLLGQQCDPVLAEFFIHDVTDPTVDSDTQPSYPTTATITLTAHDEANGSGLASISYVVDGDENTQTVSAGSTQIEIGGVGNHSLEYWATDNEGNESAHQTDDFTIADVGDPTADDDAVGAYAGTAVIHITADDNVAVDHISWRIDGGSWTEVAGAEATVTVTAVGPHTLQYQAFDTSDNSSPVYSAMFTVTRSNGVTQTQIAGTNRYTTSVEISEVAFPDGADWVVVATGNNWPDALGGSALAGALEGPILLTDTNTLPSAVAAEITRLGAGRAVILGGTAAVGRPVETALKGLLGAANVERLAGTNRYETADKVGARTIAELGAGFDGTAFVSTGANYPDALGAAPLAAGLHWPLFLTKPAGLDPATRSAMTGVTHALVLGGPAVVSPAIETSLKGTYGAANVERLAGNNRYETAVAVATYGVAHGLHWNQVAIATGEKFPDALAGGVLQGLDGSVMLLTPTASLNASVRSALVTNRLVIAEVRYLGGTGAVSQNVRNSVAAALQ